MGSDVQIFINEYSLQEQFYDASEFQNAIIILSSLVSRIREKRIRNTLYKSELFTTPLWQF